MSASESRTHPSGRARPRRSARAAIALGVVAAFAVPQVPAQASVTAAAAAAEPTFATGLANAVSIKATPSGRGLLLLGRDGTVLAYGDAPQLGNATLPHAAVTLAVTHSGMGSPSRAWLRLAADT